MILKDEVSDSEEVIIKDLKAAITKHIGSFAVPHCFMVGETYDLYSCELKLLFWV